MRPEKSYLLCSLPRSGSWLLSFALEDTGLAGHPYPFFCARVMDYCAATYSLPSPPPVRDYVHTIVANSITVNGVFGAKVEWHDLEYLFDLVREQWSVEPAGNERRILQELLGDTKIIYLERCDKIRETVSFCRALETREWAYPAGGSASLEAGDIDFERLDKFFDLLVGEEAEWHRFFQRNEYEPIMVEYESYTRDQPSFAATVVRILRHIGVSVPDGFVPPEPRQERQADEVSEEIVRQYRARRVGMGHSA